MSLISRRFVGPCLFTAFLALGCGSEDAPPPAGADEVEIVPFRSTRVLTAADLALLEPDQGDGRLTFSGTPPSLADVEPGQVIVAGKSKSAPHGLLRVVKSVNTDSGSFELDTLYAPLQLAFRKVHIKSVMHSTGELGSTAWPGDQEPLGFDPFHRHVGASQKVNVVVFDGDGDVTTTNDQVVIDGELGGSVDFSLQLDFDWGGIDDLPKSLAKCVLGFIEGQFDCSAAALLPEGKATLSASPSLASHIELHGASLLDFQRDFVLYEANVGELDFGGFVIVTPHVEIVARAEGSASAAFSTSVNAAIDFDTSLTVSSKTPDTPQYQPPKLERTSFDAEPPQVTLTASAKAGLGVELSTLLYGVSGPYLSARAFGAVSADVFRNPCVNISAGLEGSIGIKVTTPAILWLDPKGIVDKSIDFGPIEHAVDIPVPACEPPPNASMLPPGSGPDANHFAKPAFQPWSHTWSSLMDGLGSQPGGTSYWVDEQRSIDGRVVVAARGAAALTKLDESGARVWSQQFFSDAADPNSILHPVRVIPTRDAALLVLAEQGLPPLSVMKVTQAGNVVWRRELDIPNPIDCGVSPVALTRDDSTGFYAVVACGLVQRFYVVHLDETGEVLDASSYSDANATAVTPTVAAFAGSDLFVSGRVSADVDSMFALRRDAQGNVVFAKRYVACQEGPDVYPERTLVEDNGDVTVAGRGGAEHNGFVARLKSDGSVGFAAFPGLGFGAGAVFVLDSIAELPTTGYVVGGTTVTFDGVAPDDVPSMALLQLDAVGKPVWVRRYTLQSSTGDYAPAAQTALELTDDGGILATAIALRGSDSAADLWAMKVAAKDGLIDFAPGTATASSLGTVTALPCSLRDEAWDVAPASESGVTTAAVSTDVAAITPDSVSQTP